jgi:hypothetical protein
LEFKRTHRTALTDDELMLFDAMFDAWDTPESLLPENYRTSHNLPYCHGLDAAALRRVTQALIDGGLLRSRTERGPRGDMTWLALTERGGALWTLEREPLWDRYCIDSSWPTEPDDGSWTLSVRSPVLETAQAFLNAARRCNLHDVDLDRVTVEMKPREALVPWRMFEDVYELRTRVPRPESGPVDWGLYEKERTWWRTVLELGGLEATAVGDG